jgi:hypothetical protein
MPLMNATLDLYQPIMGDSDRDCAAEQCAGAPLREFGSAGLQLWPSAHELDLFPTVTSRQPYRCGKAQIRLEAHIDVPPHSRKVSGT